MNELTLPTFLTAYSALIQAFATVVLVFLTSYYVQQVKRSASELRETRRSEFMPLLAVRMVARGANVLDVYLSNIGRGLAQRPRVLLPFEHERTIERTIAHDEKDALVTFQGVGTAEIMELPEEERIMRVEYQDIFGRTIISEARLTGIEPIEGDPKSERLTLVDWRIIVPEE